MVSSTQVLAAEMEKVRKKLPLLYDLDDQFYTSIQKKQVEVISERDMRIPLALRPGGYFGYYDPNGGDMGLGDGPSWDKAVINTNHFKIGIQWTKQAEYGTDDTRKSTINLFKELMAKSMPEFRRQSDSQCMTAGNCILATVTSVSTTTLTNDTLTCTTDGFGVRLLRYGQRVNIYDSTLATNRTAAGPAKIVSIDLVNKKVVLDQTISGITGTDYILPEGISGASPVGLFGVPYHVSGSTSGSWLGFTRSTTPEVVSNQINANSASLALPFARIAMNRIHDRLGIDKNTKMSAWMHKCQVQAYEQLGQLVVRIDKSAKEEDLDLYFNENMRLAGVPVKQSMSWDKTRIDFLTDDNWGRAELNPVGFHEVGGRRIFEMRGNSGGVAAAQIFYIVASWNLFCDNPAAQAYISNLKVPSGY